MAFHIAFTFHLWLPIALITLRKCRSHLHGSRKILNTGFKHITEGNIRGFIDTYKHVVKIYVHFISIFSLHVLLEIITVFVNESLLMNSPSRKEMGCQPEAEAVCCAALYSSHSETIALTPWLHKESKTFIFIAFLFKNSFNLKVPARLPKQRDQNTFLSWY